MVLAAVTLLQGASTTDGTTFVTASCTTTAGRLTLLFLTGMGATTPNVAPTVSGHGITYPLLLFLGSGAFMRCALYASLEAQGAGPLTITYPASPVVTGCSWSVAEFTGHDARSVSHAVAHASLGTGSGTANGPTYALPAPATYGGYNALMLPNVAAAEAVTNLGDFLPLSRGGHATPTGSQATQWKASAIGAAGWTWTTSTSGRGVYLLIRPALSGTGPASRVFLHRRRR